MNIRDGEVCVKKADWQAHEQGYKLGSASGGLLTPNPWFFTFLLSLPTRLVMFE